MNINYYAPINNLGYGVVGINILKELAKLADVALFPIGNIESDISNRDLLDICLSRRSFFCYNAPSLKIYHQNHMAERIGKGLHVGFPFFELETLTDIERHHLSSLDRIFVATKWARQVLLNNSITNDIRVIPLGVDNSIFNYAVKPESDKCIFLNIGKWEVRKGHDILMRAFSSAFPKAKKDNVELWMLCNNPFLSKSQTFEWENLYRSDNRVKLLNRVGSHKDVAAIMQAADCGVWPSRAEGWNLEALEMLSCGKPVILSNCTAHTEYANNDNAYLIQHTNQYEPAFDGIWFNGQGDWMKITDDFIDELILHMKDVYDKKINRCLQSNISGLQLSGELTWLNTAKKIISNLD